MYICFHAATSPLCPLKSIKCRLIDFKPSLSASHKCCYFKGEQGRPLVLYSHISFDFPTVGIPPSHSVGLTAACWCWRLNVRPKPDFRGWFKPHLVERNLSRYPKLSSSVCVNWNENEMKIYRNFVAFMPASVRNKLTACEIRCIQFTYPSRKKPIESF